MKCTYLWSKYQSLIGRKGKKKTLVAVGHKILISCYQVLKYKVPYRELGAYLTERKRDRIARSYKKRLTNLGYVVTLKEVA
jgi:transposase